MEAPPPPRTSLLQASIAPICTGASVVLICLALGNLAGSTTITDGPGWLLAPAIAAFAILAAGSAWALVRATRAREARAISRAEQVEAILEQRKADLESALIREQDAEKAARAKSGFLATMSHEIRTPMNAVLGLAGTLLESQLPPQQRAIVSAIRDAGDTLLRLLNDILDFSKLDAGRMTLEDAPFSPAQITHNVVSILGPRATAKGLSITADSDPNLPDALLGDGGRIRQVLLNLVSNAVKFTDAGSVALRADCIARTDFKAEVEWTIRDTGIGMSEAALASLFGEFVQADTSIARRFGGSGLGLAICKRLLDQMGGTIAVVSAPGRGTTVRVRLMLPVTAGALPTQRAVPSHTMAAFNERLRALGRPLRILFAEDNSTNQLVAIQLLKGLNVQVDMAGDGLEAIDAASSFLYDVICMDVRMPELDGLSATRLLRKRRGHLASVPIIALTANAFPDDIKECLSAGMNLFVPKPFTKEMLLNAILTAVTEYPAPARTDETGSVREFRAQSTDVPAPPAREDGPGKVADAPNPPADPIACIPIWDERGMETLTQDLGSEGVSEMLTLFETETEARLDRLSHAVNGQATVREVHTLKGAAATVHAARLAARAAMLERRLLEGGTIAPADVPPLVAEFAAWKRASNERRLLREAGAA